MHDAHEFLKNLALVLCVAAATSLLFQRLRQPVVFGYLIAGMLVGPHIPVPLVADMGMVQTLSELGVILVMFSLGLEFNLRSLMRVGVSAGLIALIECGAMLWVGFSTARLLGWGVRESLFTGAILSISSTTILVKAFDELKVKSRYTDVVFGVLVFEDLIAILLLTLLTAVAAGGEITLSAIGLTVGRMVSFLVGLIGFGLLIVPRIVRYVKRAGRPELTLVSSIGICFASALLALTFGYSVALGAFIAGSLVSESGDGTRIAHLVEPVRDLFAAIFFVSVGMLLDPRLVWENIGIVLLFAALVLVGKTLFVSVGAFFAGHSPRSSVQAGMAMSQIGEFSFIIAGLGLSAGVVRPALYPVAVAVSAITSLATPFLIRRSGDVASAIDRRSPHAVQNFVALYGSWVEGIRSAPTSATSAIGKQIRILAIDAALIAALVILAHLEVDRFTAVVATTVHIDDLWAGLAFRVSAALISIPLLIGLVRNARKLGATLAARAIPATGTKLDLGATPRRMFVVTLQLGVLATVTTPVLLVTQPFVPVLRSALVLVVLGSVFAMVFWRQATDLYGHTRAGAEVIAMALAQHEMAMTMEQEAATITRMHRVVPGLGDPVPVKLVGSSRAVGRTLADLDLRSRTGATVLAVHRVGSDSLVPTGHEVLQEGDTLALAGTHEAIEKARRKLGAAYRHTVEMPIPR
jgi:CPA2 family monovalent cation:H+ antiporter-2